MNPASSRSCVGCTGAPPCPAREPPWPAEGAPPWPAEGEPPWPLAPADAGVLAVVVCSSSAQPQQTGRPRQRGGHCGSGRPRLRMARGKGMQPLLRGISRPTCFPSAEHDERDGPGKPALAVAPRAGDRLAKRHATGLGGGVGGTRKSEGRAPLALCPHPSRPDRRWPPARPRPRPRGSSQRSLHCIRLERHFSRYHTAGTPCPSRTSNPGGIQNLVTPSCP